MISRYTKLRWRRRIRHKQKELEVASGEVSQQLNRLVVRRWQNLQGVQRFVTGWLVLVGLLVLGLWVQIDDLRAYYQVDTPIAGGTFREGQVGEITNMNPIFAATSVDRSTARLVFSPLFVYDKDGRLVGDLASSWEVDKNGTVYTIKLRDNAKWHDGQPVTAEDVVFTYKMIQHPDTGSYLAESVREVEVKAVDKHTVTFTLPNPFAPFIDSLARGGILPSHELQSVKPSELRGHPFNTTRPLGSGPFTFQGLEALPGEQRQLKLARFEDYHNGAPLLEGFVIRTFVDHEAMVQSFADGEITAMAGMRNNDRPLVERIPDAYWNELTLDSGTYVFLRTTDALLSDVNVRQALVMATDQNKVIDELGNHVKKLRSPLLPTHIGYKEEQTQFGYSPTDADRLLNASGWTMPAGGRIRTKNGEPLRLIMITQNSDDYPEVAKQLQKQWGSLGVDLRVQLVNSQDIQQNHIVPHNYQILLYGLTIGKDPDVFEYWHSSQINPGGFNLSEYKSAVSDQALEFGRTRLDPRVRAPKYEPFLKAWRNDAPAIGLYQPVYGYVLHDNVHGFEPSRLSNPTDRYLDVQRWTIRTEAADKLY